MDRSRRSRRTQNACQRCRSRKVKCSGIQPCEHCRRRGQDCVFDEDRKIVISEGLFLSMKRKLEERNGNATIEHKRTRLLDSSEPAESRTETTEERQSEERFVSNPLVSASYLKHNGQTQRAWLCLGPTSTWSFSRRVLSIIQTRVHPDSTRSIPLAVDGDAYQIHWSQASSDEPPDISGLPSIDYALYMLSTVKFHLSPMYRFFDEKEFLCNLYEFYDNAPVKAQESRLWYIQFLMVLAFGEAFLTPMRTAENTENWTRFFTRALSLLPDITGLWQDPILAIEVLALIALYFHSVDIRDTAYCYIGHAMRMALVEGWHRALPVEQLGEKMVERCKNIWWTIYILDSRFSSLIGTPNSVSDEDITAMLWDLRNCSQEAAALTLHVKISQVVTRVLNTVYSVDGKLGGVFLRKMRSVLHEMTDLSRELENVFAHRFQNSVDAISGVTTRLTLSCHLCIIVTVRPLILSLLWERLSCHENGDSLRPLSAPVRTIVQSCIDSAIKSLRLLTALRNQNLLESFLPFDLESLFSAAWVLSMISAIFPDTLPDHSYRDTSFSLLDDMIERGNRVAQFRKSEIELLEDLVQPLLIPSTPLSHSVIEEPEPLITPRSETVPGFNELDVQPVIATPSLTATGIPDANEEDLTLDWRDFGTSLNEMLSATEELDANWVDMDGGLGMDLWLWDN
ncbi:putative C6 transcription factor [Aspergillus glaucus CBS 516.65]|uniref:Zn(2)-C6 fungal-type domain-containing protein n=1 Tax=Aspergillus glaucus CBS 516.65 TaxID=1160497 RepID=A0A1L9V781_ASPGL|nr:hypothetical protein ASPGLDRAFT_158435 [Aspergillus glaucus CBS 516.65]OJJ79766.1 hypothetical protein ASPGLDRAFT_158435 [Aspergillus glaucus CBS 516.65]